MTVQTISDGVYWYEQPPQTTVTLDVTDYRELRIVCGDKFVATTPEHFVDCMAWLLTNVDTNTLVTKDGIEVDE